MAVNVFFLRVSSSSQQLESQFDEVWDYYSKVDNLDRDSIKVIEYKESGVKLTEEERLGITELKTLVDTEGVDTIYVSELSRIARTEKVLWSFVEYLQSHKIQLKCKNPEFCLLSEDRTTIPLNSRLMVSTFGTLATQEAIEKKRRFARGKARKAKEGKYNGGAIPYGYKKDTEHENLIVIDEGGEAEIVREIYNMYENGVSQPQIAKELYKRGIKGRAARATKNFTISLVHQILTNELLTGAPHLNKGSSYERSYPMIITPAQFKRCREIAEKNNTAAPKAAQVYYAHRLIKCLGCGRTYVSSGNKGYYHCRDAYDYNKYINGYPDEPRCTNRVCISTNIMDSLLWEVAKDYECTFIMNAAQQKVEECDKAISILQQKIAAIPSLREGIETRMDLLLDALAEGMKKERFNQRKQDLLKEKKDIETEEAEYKEQLAKYVLLRDETKKNMATDFETDTDTGMDNFLNWADEVAKRVNAITSDKERSNIIHKHIYEVTVEKTTINYKFEKYPEGKDVTAKKILIKAYMDSIPKEFYFIPFNGKGGVMLQKNPSGGETFSPTKNFEQVVPMYTVFHMEYLPRIYDKWKRKKREINRSKRESIKSTGTEKLRKQGYISMNEMRELSQLSYSTIYKAIKDGKIKGAKNMFKTWYAKKDKFEAYLNECKPQPRPYRQTSSVVHLDENGMANESQMQKLYEAVMENMKDKE